MIPHSFADRYQNFGETCCLCFPHPSSKLKMEVAQSS